MSLLISFVRPIMKNTHGCVLYISTIHFHTIMISEKIDRIKKSIAKHDGVLVAFSGGVDSVTLAALAVDVLGEHTIAVTLDGCMLSRRELRDAIRTARVIGIRHQVVTIDVLADPHIAGNDPDRCYFCKKIVCERLLGMLGDTGYDVVLEGTNASDVTGCRPGWRAITEAGNRICSPYVESGVTKAEVRAIARSLGLEVAGKPSNACLMTRLPVGETVTKKRLARVEVAEDLLVSLGVSQVRVRDHGRIARIEVCPVDLRLVTDNREHITSRIKELGFDHVTLDIEGFRSGSMDDPQ